MASSSQTTFQQAFPQGSPTLRHVIFTCMDPRLNNVLGKLFPEHFTVRYPGGYIPKPGVSAIIDNTFSIIGKDPTFNSLIVSAHTDCVAVRSGKNGLDPIINSAWEKSGEHLHHDDVAKIALDSSIENIKNYGWSKPIIGLTINSTSNLISILDQQSNKFEIPTQENPKSVIYPNERSNLKLFEKIEQHNQDIIQKSIANQNEISFVDRYLQSRSTPVLNAPAR